MIDQDNSYIALLEQISILNKNAIEFVMQLSNVTNSDRDTVTGTMINSNGETVSQYEFPTVGYMKSQIDTLKNNVKRLAGLGDTPTYIIDGKSLKRVYTSDLNREPSPINTINTVSTFETQNNWFFENMMNPMMSVRIDLTGLIDDGIQKILSRRYIVKFQKDENGNLTAAGQASLNTFRSLYLNKNNINMQEFLNWYTNSTNLGVVDNSDPTKHMDEQVFDLNFKEVQYGGNFSVLGHETDPLNNKIWYRLNSLQYFSRNPQNDLAQQDTGTGLAGTSTVTRSANFSSTANSIGIKTLTVGDELILNNKSASSRYKILEISTINSQFKISVERIEGYDPIPVGTDVLSFYSSLLADKGIKITVGFDEYNVVFVKPINTNNNIRCHLWSKGMSFFTNELVLSTNSNMSFVDFYLSTVNDYGELLKDLVAKKIPSSYGVKPNTVLLDANQFKVVQINKHLTDSRDLKLLKQLHAKKNNIKSQLDQINSAINELNKELNTRVFSSISEKSQVQNTLKKNINEQAGYTRQLTSIIGQITNYNVDSVTDPKYRVRGFWRFPAPKSVAGFRPQEVIGFEIQYRYSHKNGNTNNIEGFKMNVAQDSQVTIVADASILPSQSQNTLNVQLGKKIDNLQTAYYSNWIPVKTDIRSRYYDVNTDEWYWTIEDMSDAEIPNINQLDIALQPNERVEVKIRAISEVGYPETQLYSDWSETLSIDFPDELAFTTNENQQIVQQALQENIMVQMMNELETKNLTTHLQESFYINQQYYAHGDRNIITSFKDSNGNSISLNEYLISLNNKMLALDEIVRRAKGELKVSLFRGSIESEIKYGATVNINVECEDYGQLIDQTVPRVYSNIPYGVFDFKVSFQNIAQYNALEFLSNRLYTFPSSGGTNPFAQNIANAAMMIDDDDILYPQQDYQFIWFSDNDAGNKLYSAANFTDYYNNDIMASTSGVSLGLDISDPYSYNYIRLFEMSWNSGSSITSYQNNVMSTVHPKITRYPKTILASSAFTDSYTTDLVESGQEKIKMINAQTSFTVPVNLYFRFNASASTTFNANGLIGPPPTQVRKLKFYMETENSRRPFEFTLVFNVKQYRLAIVSNTNYDNFNQIVTQIIN